MQRKMLLLLAAVVAVVGLTIAGCGTATKAGSKGVQKAARKAGESKAVTRSEGGVRLLIRRAAAYKGKKIQHSARAIAEDY